MLLRFITFGIDASLGHQNVELVGDDVEEAVARRLDRLESSEGTREAKVVE